MSYISLKNSNLCWSNVFSQLKCQGKAQSAHGSNRSTLYLLNEAGQDDFFFAVFEGHWIQHQGFVSHSVAD